MKKKKEKKFLCFPFFILFNNPGRLTNGESFKKQLLRRVGHDRFFLLFGQMMEPFYDEIWFLSVIGLWVEFRLRGLCINFDSFYCI